MAEEKSDLVKQLENEDAEKAPVRTIRRFNRRAGDNASSSSSTWLVSFTDVMALMLTFFVLLFSMSNPKKEQWEKFTQEVQENFNRFYGRPLNRAQQDAVNIKKINYSRALDLNYLEVIVNNLVEKEESLKDIQIMPNGKNLIISFPDNLLFDVGEATVKTEGQKALFSLASALTRIKNRIEVVGHTDPRPVNDPRFPSNWELSLTRAANVGAVLENVGYKRPVTIRGHASARYQDLPTTIPLQKRLDLSRRVDVVIMEDDGRPLKLFDIGIP